MRIRSLFVLTLLSLVVLSGCTGSRRFQASSGWSGVAVDSSNELVYVGSRDGRVLELNTSVPSNVRLQALFPPANLDPLEGLYGTPTLANDMLMVSGYGGRLYALNASDLKLLWQFPTDISTIGRIVGGSVVEGGRVIFGSSDGFVRALSVSDGSLAWEYKTDHMVWSTPTVADGVVYVGSLDHRLYALSTRDGSPVWNAPFKADGAIVAKPLVLDSKVVFGSFDANLYALDAGSGREVWRVEGDGWFWSSPISDGKRVFASTTRGTVYAVDLDTGVVLWTFDLQKQALSTPVLVDGNLIVASDNGLLYVLSSETGTQLSAYNVGAEVRAPLQTDGEVVYVNAMDKTVWAIRMAGGSQERVWQIDTSDLVGG